MTENYFSYWRNINFLFKLTATYREMQHTIKTVKDTGYEVRILIIYITFIRHILTYVGKPCVDYSIFFYWYSGIIIKKKKSKRLCKLKNNTISTLHHL